MWLDEDYAAAIAWQDEQASLCPGCSHPTDETTARDASYFAEPIICKLCQARHNAARQWSEDGGAAGVLWIARPSPDLIPD